MGEGGKGKPLSPIGLEMIDKDIEVLFDFLVDLFGLSIGLRMKGSQSIAFNLEKIIEIFYEFGNKHCFSIKDDYLQHSVFGIHFIT